MVKINVKNIKYIILYISKSFGFFHLSKFLTKYRLRILCYHGFSFSDQNIVMPKLFINKETFSKRINYLIYSGYNFVDISSIDNVITRNEITKYPVLVTFDDGWKGVHEFGLPILKINKIPHVVYLYTDIFQKEMPVLNVLLKYIILKTKSDNIFYSGKTYNLKNESESNVLIRLLYLNCYDADEKNFKKNLEVIMNIFNIKHCDHLVCEHFRLMNISEIIDHLYNDGSIQLHTHHHVNSLQDDHLSCEILDNKKIIENITYNKAEHFCYPSGVYSTDQFPLLQKLGIKSAVTCKPGLNDSTTHPYELKRFLDGENISQIEFEAEMCGFMDFVRKIFRRG